MSRTATKPRPEARSAVDYRPVVDGLQRVRSQIKDLKKKEAEFRAQLLDGGKRRYHGTSVDAVLVDGSQVRLDTDKIRADMPFEWVKAHEKEIPCTTIELEPRLPPIVAG